MITSDEFFNKKCSQKYDIIFIDGLHVSSQTLKDFDNALNFLNDNGTIMMHDCHPTKIKHVRSYKEFKKQKGRGGSWCGDVWKAIAHLIMTRDDLKIRTVSKDFGLGVIRRGHGNKSNFDIPVDQMDFDFLKKNRKELLNLVSWEELLNSLNE